MAKPKMKGIINIVKETVSQHSPEILTGIGIAGMVTTTVLAVKATPKALQLMDIEKARINRDLVKEAADRGEDMCNQIDKLTVADVVKTCWKCYIPAAVTGVLSATCLIGASSVNLKRNAALATAYKLSETALSEYRDAVVETIGEKKEKVVKDKIAEKKLENDPISKKEVYITEKGNTLCYDSISGRYFKSDMETIKRAENQVNKTMLNEMCVSLNEFYDEIGLDHAKIGDELGWRMDDGLIEIDFSSQIADDGQPCLVINYDLAPRYNYYKLN